ncbi:MAG: sulfotransferase family protein [Cyanobacteria bacterium P01_A01_bin.123]
MKPKVFGIGLSRTGTKSLTQALNDLGFKVIHYPEDVGTLETLIEGHCQFPLLEQYDGLTDITVSAFYAQLDRLFPGSKFILTVRNKADWLRSLEVHWRDYPSFPEAHSAQLCQRSLGTLNAKTKLQIHGEILRILRAIVYGCYEFNHARASYVYDLHHHNVLDYFKARSDDLLVLDICAGEGWSKLCPFLNQPLVHQSFPVIRKEAELMK